MRKRLRCAELHAAFLSRRRRRHQSRPRHPRCVHLCSVGGVRWRWLVGRKCMCVARVVNCDVAHIVRRDGVRVLSRRRQRRRNQPRRRRCVQRMGSGAKKKAEIGRRLVQKKGGQGHLCRIEIVVLHCSSILSPRRRRRRNRPRRPRYVSVSNRVGGSRVTAGPMRECCVV